MTEKLSLIFYKILAENNIRGAWTTTIEVLQLNFFFE